MSKINQIQNALMAIDQASFQKLCDAYAYRTFDIKEINSVGSVSGETKTRTGHPDTLITLKSGKHILIEATTEQTGHQAKFSADLDKCFDESKTGVKIEDIDRIILACNRKLSHKVKTELIEKGRGKDCIVDFLDLDTLSFDLYQKHQPLAKEFLGIELDTGQILSLVDFVNDYQKNKFATPLNNEFYCRDKELAEIQTALRNDDFVVIAGKAGVGKSRTALEAMRRFQELNPSYKPFCITNKNLDLYENLKDYFGPDGDYLILVDDANRLSQLSHVLRLLHEQGDSRKFKIVATVRDYAMRKVRDDTKAYSHQEVWLQKFTLEEMTQILENGFGIRNHDYISRIHKISDGNPRLAVMAAMVALETNRLDSINDVSDLYDIYFESINDDLKEFGNDNLIQAAGIISFFRTLDRTRGEDFESVANAFGVTAEELWIALERLHELEVVDLDFEVAKISDQILGTYLFYKTFFKDEVLDFSVLLTGAFQGSSYRLVDALNPVLNTFDSKLILDRLRPLVVRRWEEIKHDEEEALPFIRLFHYLNETEFLMYLKSRIDALPIERVEESELNFTPETYQPLKDRYLEALRHFQTENVGVVLDLIFAYLEKNLWLLREVIHLLTDGFGFDEKSHFWNYFIQQTVVSKLIEKSEGENGRLYQRIFLKVASNYTQMVFRSNSSSGMTVTIYTVPLRPVESMIELRAMLWRRLIRLYKVPEYEPDVRKIMQNYFHSWRADASVREIVENDREILTPFIRSLNPESYEDCVLAQNYVEFLERVGVDFDEAIRAEFTNKTYEISQVLLHNYRKEVKLGYEEYEKYREAKLTRYFGSYTFEDYDELFEHCLRVQKTLTEPNGAYQFGYAVISVLQALSRTNEDLFVKVVDRLLELGNPLYLAGDHIVQRLLEVVGDAEQAYDFVNRHDFTGKASWGFSFFQLLPQGFINGVFLAEIYELYQTAPLAEIPQSFDYLEKYSDFDSEIILKVTRILFDRVKEGEGAFSFHSLIDYGRVSDKLAETFSSDLILLKEVYFHASRNERYSDYKSKALRQIFSLDKNFLFEFLEFLIWEKQAYEILHDGSWDYSFIWEDDRYDELFERLFEIVYGKENERGYFWGPSFLEIFFRNLETEKREKAAKLLLEMMIGHVWDASRCSYIFQIVSNCLPDKRREFLEAFLNENKNGEDFNRLSFESNHVVMAPVGGQEVPILESKITFYKSLMPLFDSVDLLGHKLRIEEHIAALRDGIERAKKRDFVGYF